MKKAPILIAALALVAAACSETSSAAADDDPIAAMTAGTAAPAISTTTTTEIPREEEGHADEGHDDADTHAEEPMGDMDHNDEPLDGDSYPAAIGAVTSEYSVTLAEFLFDRDSLDLTPGETVRFTLTNEGVVEHEFRLTTEHAAAEHLEGGHSDHGDANGDIIVMVPAGQMREVEMTLPTDTTFDLLACLIPGHYEAGMFGTVE